MKRKKIGFTLVELLMVLAIITLLVGLLVPSMATVRRFARETKQKAQLNTIDLALTAFRNDYGDYPPSNNINGDYGGAQMLAEALLGRDLMGFHPDSTWDAAGTIYNTDLDLNNRRGRYLELGTATAFRLGVTAEHGGLFVDTGPLDPDTFVICDSFGVKKITVAPRKTVKAGTPILYYRANPSSRELDSGNPAGSIYNYVDNDALVGLKKIGDATVHPLNDYVNVFYSANGGVVDPRVAVPPWPYRPDSYILISAGADGLYGTPDDITNFGN